MSADWPVREAWDAMLAGVDCPLCGDFPEVDGYGYNVARLSKSLLRLARNQYSAGYCVLVCTEHGPEPYSLSPADSAAYLQDMSRAGAALEQVFGADKMNFLTLGNAVPHLHTHLIPRYHGDPAPGQPYLAEHAAEVTLTDTEYRDRVNRIRAALEV
ncbi:MAG TPA: HIT family protein [Mycobacteriales bacterium]|nr:HIT family protein [Mycobacteriales bacterium]